MTDFHSNVVDLAREISHYVDPENVLPSVRCCHQLTPPEVKRVVEVLGGQEQLQEHKPQNYCFAILPADNQMQSVLFDYTGTFRPCPDNQVCPLHAQEEDGFHTPPSTPTNEVPRMLPPVQTVAHLCIVFIYHISCKVTNAVLMPHLFPADTSTITSSIAKLHVIYPGLFPYRNGLLLVYL